MKSAKNCDWLAIFALTLAVVGIFYRFAALDDKIFWHDEVYTSLFLAGTPNNVVYQTLVTGQPLAPSQLQFYQHLHDDKTVLDVVRSLLAFDPHHPPLYYVALWSWTKIFGDSTWHLRLFSAFCGVLILPAWFWLCRELFGSWRAALIGLVVMSVAPFHVLYAQEARPYAIWSLAICLASAALLWAIRASSHVVSRRAWWIYGATLWFGLYTHLLFVFVVAAHALWVWFWSRARNKTNGVVENEHRVLDVRAFETSRLIRKSFNRSIAVASMLYAPFLWLLLRRQNATRAHLDWTTVSTSFAQRLQDWTSNLSVAFFDAQPLQSQMLWLRALVALGAIAALIYTARRAPRGIAAFVVLLFACSVLPFLLPDLLLGGRRSQIARFLIPSILALQLAVVYVLYAFSQARKTWRQFGILCAVLLIGGGWISCEASRRSAHWWNKGRSFSVLEIASVVNRSPRPLVVSDARDANWGNGISLSKYLRDDARILFQNDAANLILPAGFSTIYVLSPDVSTQRHFAKSPLYALQKTDIKALWKVSSRLK